MIVVYKSYADLMAAIQRGAKASGNMFPEPPPSIADMCITVGNSTCPLKVGSITTNDSTSPTSYVVSCTKFELKLRVDYEEFRLT